MAHKLRQSALMISCFLFLFAILPNTLTAAKKSGKDSYLSGIRNDFSPSSQTSESPLIAYRSIRQSANSDIFITDLNGMAPRNLSNDQNMNSAPIWSPDGRRIAFFSMPGLDSDSHNAVTHIFDMETNKVTRLTDPSHSNYVADWSPDGKRLLLISDETELFNLYEMNIEDKNITPLTRYDSLCEINYAQWSPDGKYIVFELICDGNPAEIHVLELSTGETTNISNNDAFDDYNPIWSPDSQHIAFMSSRDGDDDIYKANTDGTGLRNLTRNSNYDGIPQWSPDGSKIVFISMEDGLSEIYTVSIETEEINRLTNDQSNHTDPSWSPDGKYIAFASDRDGDSEIYIMNADGSQIQQITFSEAGVINQSPHIQPQVTSPGN